MSRNNLKIAHLNVRSLLSRFHDFKEMVLTHKFNIITISESWLSPDVESELVNIQGYKLFRNDRLTRGGGIATYVNTDLNIQIIDINMPNDGTLEYLWLKLKLNNKLYAIGTFYRQPNSNLQNSVDAIDQMLSVIVPTVDAILCLGDFNVNLFNLNNLLTHCFDAYNFEQLINQPTRVAYNGTSTLLDPIFSSDKNIIKNSSVINADHISDHKLVQCELNLKCPKFKQKFIKFRDFKHFDYERFLTDLQSIPFQNLLWLDNIESKVELLTLYITTLFDIHAPLRVVRVSKPKAPWLTDNIRRMIKERDKALSTYKRTQNAADYDYYKQLRNHTLTSIRNEKKAYVNNICRQGNIKNTWKTLKTFNVKKCSVYEIPSSVGSASDINNHFASAFYNQTNNVLIDYYNNNSHSDAQFSFRLCSIKDVGDIIRNFKTNACGVDGISLIMLNYCCPHIEPYITHIINCCLELGHFPDLWKEALIIPLPKSNDVNCLSDLRPISILPILSKILEKIVHKQLFEFVNENNILHENQSGFRKGHSTSTALTRVVDDIAESTDKKKVTAVVLLDFSKAFDTISHELMYAKLKYFGLDHKSISFFNSYLNNRSQKVFFNDSTSPPLEVLSGVPQGSVLGPLLFSIYTSDILHSAENCKIQAYADDTQVYNSFHIRDSLVAQNNLNGDLRKIKRISQEHNLKLNPNKCKLILFGPKKDLASVCENFSLNIDNEILSPETIVKNLGLNLDQHLKFSGHINTLLSKAYGSLKLLYSSRFFIGRNLRKILCESLVLSHFNYCDVVYSNFIDSVEKRRIQRVQNSCCRFIFSLRRYDHISHTFSGLNWLNMQFRRRLHFLVFVHRILSTSVPSYLFSRLSTRSTVHNRTIRFGHLYHIDRHFTAAYQNCFTYCSAKLYNALPSRLKSLSVTSFKTNLKQLLLEEQKGTNFTLF